eukprot:985642-Rhodomonas_salina.1
MAVERGGGQTSFGLITAARPPRATSRGHWHVSSLLVCMWSRGESREVTWGRRPCPRTSALASECPPALTHRDTQETQETETHRGTQLKSDSSPSIAAE